MNRMDAFDSLPNFMILGAAKAGTTTLFNLLKQHPQVYVPFTKEPMYFSNDENFRHGLGWYHKTFFRQAGDHLCRGEATPHYLYWSEKVAERIQQAYNGRKIRFLLIFRDPVKRAYSWYWNMVREGREDLDFEAALAEEPQRLQAHAGEFQRTGSMTFGYARGSRYATALKSFLERFPPQDFHTLLQEDLNRDFAHTMQGVLNFLELDPGIPMRPVTSNPASMPRSQQLQGLLLNPSGYREVLKALLPRWLRYVIRTRLLSANAKSMTYQELDERVETRLRVQLADETSRLGKLIGRDLSAWLPPS